MKLLLILSGVLVGGGLWVGYAWLRYRWRAPFEETIPPYKRVLEGQLTTEQRAALQAQRGKRTWNGDEWT